VNSVKATLYEVDPMSYSVKWENAKRFISVKKTQKNNSHEDQEISHTQFSKY
jgi:hypothetical protein